MKENYSRLGDYIREVDVRNRDLTVTTLLGLSVSKTFIPSIANTIGTDMSTYKIVEKDQFVYIADTSRRGDKIAIALLKDFDDAIVSQAYTVFEIIDHNKLLPDYLMMWFRRPEFDRYARYHSHGSAREIFDWSEMCDVQLPIPPIDRQREIVSEYETLSNRIRLNKQLIAKLEDTAQTLYRQTFVDNIDPNNLPNGWRIGVLKDVADFKYGKLAEKHSKREGYPYPIFSGYAITGYTNEYSIENQTIVIIARGDAGTGQIKMSPKKCYLSNLAISIETKDISFKNYLYYHLRNCDTMSLRSGSAQAQITINNLEPFEIIIPPTDIYKDFSQTIETINTVIQIRTEEIESLIKLQSLLLSKMGK